MLLLCSYVASTMVYDSITQPPFLGLRPSYKLNNGVSEVGSVSVYKSYSQSLSAIETLNFRLHAYLAEDQWSPEI